MDKLRRMFFTGTIFAVACGFAVSSAQAVVLYPGPFVGTDFTYSNVSEVTTSSGDPEPLYGAPTVTGNTLDFNPDLYAFAADAPPPDNTNSTLSFTYASNTAAPLPYLAIYEDGDYLFSGTTAAGELVTATIFVQIRDVNTNTLLTSASTSFSEIYDSPNVEAGFWSLNLFIDLTPYNRTAVRVTINNLLTASASGGSTAFIQKKDFQIDPEVIPEPASVALLGLGVLVMASRRRAA